MPVALYTHLDMLDHRPGDGHVESPERLRAVVDALGDDPNLELEVLDAPLVDVEDLLRVHPKAFVDAVFEAAPKSGRLALDPDTVMSSGSLAAARRAAGANAPPSAPSRRGRQTGRSAPFDLRGITLNRAWPWGSACFPMSPWQPVRLRLRV